MVVWGIGMPSGERARSDRSRRNRSLRVSRSEVSPGSLVIAPCRCFNGMAATAAFMGKTQRHINNTEQESLPCPTIFTRSSSSSALLVEISNQYFEFDDVVKQTSQSERDNAQDMEDLMLGDEEDEMPHAEAGEPTVTHFFDEPVDERPEFSSSAAAIHDVPDVIVAKTKPRKKRSALRSNLLATAASIIGLVAGYIAHAVDCRSEWRLPASRRTAAEGNPAVDVRCSSTANYHCAESAADSAASLASSGGPAPRLRQLKKLRRNLLPQGDSTGIKRCK